MSTLLFETTPSVWTAQALAQRIDLTRLVFAPDEDRAAVLKDLCKAAAQYGFRAVCVRPEDLAQVSPLLEGSDVGIATVIAFPEAPMALTDAQASLCIGAMPLEAKQAQIHQAVSQGATELDIVMTVSELKLPGAGIAEMLSLVEWAQGVPIKLILETDLLTPDEIESAVLAAGQAGITVVKTSTGMLQGGQGATPQIIRQMRQLIEANGWQGQMGIKASGGIRTRDQALTLLAAGADILGASSGVAMVESLPA